MNFQVPQFIEIEDKVIGPLTFKQFVYLAGGAGLGFLFYVWLGWYLGAIPIILVGGLALALAFYKVNDRPFIYVMEAFIRYNLSNKLYIWKKRQVNKEIDSINKNLEIKNSEKRQTLPQNKLHELTWSLNIKDTSKNDQPTNSQL